METSSKLICLFAHFNARREVSQYVITFLEHLESLGFEILFISNSPIKQEYRDLLIVKIRNCHLFERESKGADFGAWKWATEHNIIPENTDYLLLTNDSLYGPIFPLKPIVEKMLSKPEIDFWSLTDSYQGGWHLQSYFLCLSKKVLVSGAFKKIFNPEIREFNKNADLELTKTLSDSGFRGIAFIPYSQLSPNFEESNAKNPIHFFWDHLIEQFHFPFVKKELILDNPENIQNTDKLFALIQECGSYPLENIKQSISDYLSLYDSQNIFPNKISVLCHLYYPGAIYYFLTRISVLKSPQTQFIFNLSPFLYHNGFFCEMLMKYFPGAIILYTPNQGRDIGGKLAAFDVLLKSGIQSDYSLIIHDKLSPHSPTGIEWRNKLLKIINPDALPEIFRRFHRDKKAGVITTKELVKNEFDPDTNTFTCTSNTQLLNYIKKYNLTTSDYSFAAGTIFWIRTEIAQSFFFSHSPLSVRKELEEGNSLDFFRGTNTHAWERLFSFIAHSQGFKTIGV